jgi:hypothetical protein
MSIGTEQTVRLSRCLFILVLPFLNFKKGRTLSAVFAAYDIIKFPVSFLSITLSLHPA